MVDTPGPAPTTGTRDLQFCSQESVSRSRKTMGAEFGTFVAITSWLRNRIPTIGFKNISVCVAFCL